MWVWMDNPPHAARIVHVVEELRLGPSEHEVVSVCGRRVSWRSLSVFGVRPGQSFDLCPVCDPYLSTRAKEES